MKTHEQLHLGVRPYTCEFEGCDKSFTQLGNLKVFLLMQSHQLKVHLNGKEFDSKKRRASQPAILEIDEKRVRKARPSMEEKLLLQMKAVLNRST